MTEAAQAEILERLTAGESLRRICDDAHMPAASTVFKYLANKENTAFIEQYTRAREAQADALFDEILAIADDGRNDWIERKDEEGAILGWRENGEALRRSQLRVDARKWMAGKLRPKVYGEKIQNEHSGPNGGPIETADVSDTSRARALAAFLAKTKSQVED